MEYRCSAGVITRDAVYTILVSSPSLTCINTAATALHWRQCVLYKAGYRPGGLDECYMRIFRVASEKRIALLQTISILLLQ